MKGGYFGFGNYIYYKVEDFANELNYELRNNAVATDRGCLSLSDQAVKVLREQERLIRKTVQVMECIDKFFAGDCEEDTFLERIQQLNPPIVEGK